MIFDKRLTQKKISYILDHYYPKPKVPLDNTSSYTLLVAVLLSAQCTDERVNEVTKVLFEQANDPFKMVKLGRDKIAEIIYRCGFYKNKSKYIYNLSQMLIDEYNGEVPSDLKEMEKLPGIGHKSASVVASQYFGELTFPVDTHIHRLAYRWGISNGKNVEQTEKDCKDFFPKKSWNKVHLQIIFFGREFCPARGHKKEFCPICSLKIK